MITTFFILAGLYIFICVIAYLFQEKLIFFPEKLTDNHSFNFSQPFKEIFITGQDGKRLHGLLFKTNNAKGLIFYLHGNAGSLDGWGGVAETYTRIQYDVFLLDYRGYGKSEGHIESEEQLFMDVQAAYDQMLQVYSEDRITVIGYSIGSGVAAQVAAANSPRLVILQAPYYSLTDVMQHTVPFLPTFLLKYKLETNQFVKACRMPIVLFHGDQDEVIPYSQSLKLKPLLKESDTLITLNGVGHNGMTHDDGYVSAIERVLK